ncbi:NADH-quinone oxidoreductase subunit C [Calidifontibacter terrae]
MAEFEIPTARCDRHEWIDRATALRAEGFDYFDFLTAVDQVDDEQEPGFDVVLHLLDVTPGAYRETLLITRVPDGERLPSLTWVWPGAAWHERETFEMFGIGFDGFTDPTASGLRPLLLPDGFEGNPLRKSFVLVARATKAWPGAKEPGEAANAHAAKAGRAPRRKLQPPGVPDESWGPR